MTKATSLYNKCIALIALLLLIGFNSCQERKAPIDPMLINSIGISEYPVYIHDSLSHKPLYISMPSSIVKNITVQLGKETLSIKLLKHFPDSGLSHLMVNIPNNHIKEQLDIFLTLDNLVKKVHSFKVENYSSNDTLEFTSINYLTPRPIVILKRECWPDYDGARVGADYDFTISSRNNNEDIIKGDSITRILRLEQVKLIDADKRKTIEIKSPLHFQFTDHNWLHLVASKNQSITSPTDNLNYGLYSDEGGFPDYMLIGETIGHNITMVSKSKNTNDTLEVESLILPTHFQIGLDCNSTSKN